MQAAEDIKAGQLVDICEEDRLVYVSEREKFLKIMGDAVMEMMEECEEDIRVNPEDGVVISCPICGHRDIAGPMMETREIIRKMMIEKIKEKINQS